MTTDLDRRRALAAVVAWYAPAPASDLEPNDVEDMIAALAEASVEASLIKWAYRGKMHPSDWFPPGDLEAMERARAAAAQVLA